MCFHFPVTFRPLLLQNASCTSFADGDVREFPVDVLPDLVHPCFDLLTKPFSSIVALHVLNFNDMARYFSSNSYHFSPLEQL